MKYLKNTIILVGIFAIIGVANAFAETFYYANISIPALHGTWTSAQKEKRTSTQQSFTNNGARDALNNTYTMGGRTQAMYDPVGYSSWKYASSGGGTANWGNQNTGINDYKLHLRADNYNALSISFTGSWTISTY